MLPKKLTFPMMFRFVFSSVFWEGSGRVSGAILELKINEKSIKICLDFLIDFSMDFERILGGFWEVF